MNNYILITRPDPAGTALCQFIQAHGRPTIHLPTIAFAPSPDMRAFQQAIMQLDQQDWLIFISPHAVYHSAALLRQHWPQLPPQLKVAAIGAGTAKAVASIGYSVDCYPQAHCDSEGLLALFEDQLHISLKGQKIAIVRGVGGRELLEKNLIEKGASVLPIIAYQRILPAIDVTPYLPVVRQQHIAAIVSTSGESLQNLLTLFADDAKLLKNIPLIVISDRMKTLAQDSGFQTIWVARQADHTAILQVLEARGDNLCPQ